MVAGVETRGGLIFTKVDQVKYIVNSLTYQLTVGILQFEEGPGWVLTEPAPFLDLGDLRVIVRYVDDEIPDPDL